MYFGLNLSLICWLNSFDWKISPSLLICGSFIWFVSVKTQKVLVCQNLVNKSRIMSYCVIWLSLLSDACINYLGVLAVNAYKIFGIRNMIVHLVLSLMPQRYLIMRLRSYHFDVTVGTRTTFCICTEYVIQWHPIHQHFVQSTKVRAYIKRYRPLRMTTEKFNLSQPRHTFIKNKKIS